MAPRIAGWKWLWKWGNFDENRFLSTAPLQKNLLQSKNRHGFAEFQIRDNLAAA
jgi:hypothetical protein